MHRSLAALLVTAALAPAARADVVVGTFADPGTARSFADTAQGAVAPIRTLGGPTSQVRTPTSFAFARGELYVGDFQGQAIRVFDPRATGDRTATRTITSPTLGQPREIVADVAHNELLAITLLSFVSTYPLNANGSTASTRRIDWGGLAGSVTKIDNPSGLALLPALDQIALGDYDQPGGTGPSSGEVLFWPRTATGNVAPVRALRGPNTQLGSYVMGLALDAARNELWVLVGLQGAANPSRLLAFNAAADGDVAPLRAIEGAATLLDTQGSIAFDARQDLVWVTSTQGRLLAFPRTASGNVAPVRDVSGGPTGLTQTFGVAVLDLDAVFANGFE